SVIRSAIVRASSARLRQYSASSIKNAGTRQTIKSSEGQTPHGSTNCAGLGLEAVGLPKLCALAGAVGNVCYQSGQITYVSGWLPRPQRRSAEGEMLYVRELADNIRTMP